MRHRLLAVVAPLLLAVAVPAVAVPAVASADESVLIVDATMVSPLAEKGKVSDSFGNGAEMRVLMQHDPMGLYIGGFFAIGAPDGDKTMRDMYDFHVNFGYNASKPRGAKFIPFLSIGLDVLHMTTRVPNGGTYRGTTLGVNAKGGVQGFFTGKLFYTVSAEYLGAVVPGTGDDLGGLVLQAGLGISL